MRFSLYACAKQRLCAYQVILRSAWRGRLPIAAETGASLTLPQCPAPGNAPPKREAPLRVGTPRRPRRPARRPRPRGPVHPVARPPAQLWHPQGQVRHPRYLSRDDGRPAWSPPRKEPVPAEAEPSGLCASRSVIGPIWRLTTYPPCCAAAARSFPVDDLLSRDACGTPDSDQPSPVVCHCGKAVKACRSGRRPFV